MDELHASASAAPSVIPSTDDSDLQYNQVFLDLNASSSATSYLGLHVLDTYNWTACAAFCDCTDLCTSFNLYAERDPSLNPCRNDSSAATVWGYYCPNPPSMTVWKCTLWGSVIAASTTTNHGGWREDFNVVVTASNGWTLGNASIPDTPAGWSAPVDCYSEGIDAQSYSLGTQFFAGPFNPDVCNDYANQQQAANVQAGASQSVEMYNAYYLYKNGQPLGTQCNLYSAQLDPKVYATYSGDTVNGDVYTVYESWVFNASS